MKLKTKTLALIAVALCVISSCKDEPFPEADFSFSGSCTAPCQVSFTNLSENADTYLWEFGDGGTSSEKNPAHLYDLAGNYEVNLTASGNGTDTETKTVVIPPANAQLMITSATVVIIPSGTWDVASAPDLQVRFAKSSSATWDYVTEVATDRSDVPVTLTFSSPVPVSSENWDVQLIDEDDPDEDDVMFELFGFNPVTSGTGGKIKLPLTGEVIIELNYQE